MSKKLILIIAGVAVLVFVIPPMAMAEQEITKSAGVTAAVGTEITGTAEDLILKSSTLGSITCKKLTIKGKITVNGGGKGFAGEGNNVSPPAEDCTNGTKTVEVTSTNITNIQSVGIGTFRESFTETVDIGQEATRVHCTWTGSQVIGTFNMSGKLSFNESISTGITASPALCGTAKLIGNIQLEIGGTAVILDS